jgi:hypothetical protein
MIVLGFRVLGKPDWPNYVPSLIKFTSPQMQETFSLKPRAKITNIILHHNKRTGEKQIGVFPP